MKDEGQQDGGWKMKDEGQQDGGWMGDGGRLENEG